MNITCDPNKRMQTLLYRGLDFLDADLVFAGESYEFADIRKDYGEIRMIVVGYLMKRMVIIGYAPRGKTRHIFSMRKANEREIKKYQEQFEKSGRTHHTGS